MRLKRIEQLRACPGWTDYMRPRLVEALRKIERDVLETETLTADKVMLLRAEAKALRMVLKWADLDARISVLAAQQSTAFKISS